MKTFFITLGPDPFVINIFSCSTQLSMKSQMLIKTLNAERYKHFLLINSQMLYECILLINVKMPTIVGVLVHSLAGLIPCSVELSIKVL